MLPLDRDFLFEYIRECCDHPQLDHLWALVSHAVENRDVYALLFLRLLTGCAVWWGRVVRVDTTLQYLYIYIIYVQL